MWQFKAPRQPLGFYICSGIDLTEEFKKPLPIYGTIEISSFLLNAFFYFKIKRYKRKVLELVNVLESRKKMYLTDVDESSMVSKLITLSVGFASILIVLNQAIINKIDPNNVNVFPYTLYVYYVFFIYPTLIVLIILLVYYIRHEKLRKFVYSESKLFVESIKDW